MKWALSHIMWGHQNNEKYFKLAQELGFTGIEIAPSLIKEDPESITYSEIRELKKELSTFSLEVCSFHSLLYQKSDLQIFGSEEIQKKTIAFLVRIAELANAFECPKMIFGSPPNRTPGNLSQEESYKIASEFFHKLAMKTLPLGVTTCIEPLSPSETDFVCNHGEAKQLVESVDHSKFKMMLDAKSTTAEKSIQDAVVNSKDILLHVHVNDPGNTVPTSSQEIDHKGLGESLRKIGYKNYVSLEVGRNQGDPESNIRRSHAALETYYASA